MHSLGIQPMTLAALEQCAIRKTNTEANTHTDHWTLYNSCISFHVLMRRVKLGFFQFLENKPITILQIMKLLHHSQGYSQMYILYSETGPPISVTVVQVGSALFRLARKRERGLPPCNEKQGWETWGWMHYCLPNTRGCCGPTSSTALFGEPFSIQELPTIFGGCRQKYGPMRASQSQLVFTFTIAHNHHNNGFALVLRSGGSCEHMLFTACCHQLSTKSFKWCTGSHFCLPEGTFAVRMST